MTRTCHCVGHLSNPGGRCCMDFRRPTYDIYPCPPPVPAPTTEERLREIIREELAREKIRGGNA